MKTSNATEFSKTLKGLIGESGSSRYRLSRCSQVDEAYILRLENGQKQNPSRDLVIKLGMGPMQCSSSVTIDDVNGLLLSAGYAPLRGRGEPLTSS